MLALLALLCLLQALQTQCFLQFPKALSSRSIRSNEASNRGYRSCEIGQRLGSSATGMRSLSEERVRKLFSNGQDIPVWDIFGRVPYDDWLFTTSKLTDPNLLKRSFVEAINQEIPIAMSSYDRRMSIVNTVLFALGSIPVALFIFYVYRMAMSVKDTQPLIQARQDAIRGFKSAIGVYRKLTGEVEDSDSPSRRGKSRRDRRRSARGRRGQGGGDDDEDGDADDEDPMRFMNDDDDDDD
eukprot:Colp12_sorted_trinity150504_noHs@4283